MNELITISIGLASLILGIIVNRLYSVKKDEGRLSKLEENVYFVNKSVDTINENINLLLSKDFTCQYHNQMVSEVSKINLFGNGFIKDMNDMKINIAIILERRLGDNVGIVEIKNEIKELKNLFNLHTNKEINDRL